MYQSNFINNIKFGILDYKYLAMAKNKTLETEQSVAEFIGRLEDETKKQDSIHICELMAEATGQEPKMWGASIIGFGSLHYKYDSGHEGDAPLIGFSPRKNAISLYLASSFEGKDALLARFGKHKTGKACIYVNKLKDIDVDVLKQLIIASLKGTTSSNEAC